MKLIPGGRSSSRQRDVAPRGRMKRCSGSAPRGQDSRPEANTYRRETNHGPVRTTTTPRVSVPRHPPGDPRSRRQAHGPNGGGHARAVRSPHALRRVADIPGAHDTQDLLAHSHQGNALDAFRKAATSAICSNKTSISGRLGHCRSTAKPQARTSRRRSSRRASSTMKSSPTSGQPWGPSTASSGGAGYRPMGGK